MQRDSGRPARAGVASPRAWRRTLGRWVVAVVLGGSAVAHAEEFLVTSRWQYLAKPVNASVLAHGQADIFDPSINRQIGGIGYYCARPTTYIDIFVHEPGRPIMTGDPSHPVTELHWGHPTFRTSLKLNGVELPSVVESGVIYVDIDARIGPLLADAFALKTASKRLDIDVARLAAFTLVMKRIEPKSRPDTAIVDFDQMVEICRTTLGR